MKSGGDEANKVEQWLHFLALERVVPSRAFKMRLVRLLRAALQQERKVWWRHPIFQGAVALLALVVLLWLFVPRQSSIALLTVREGTARVYWRYDAVLFFSRQGVVEVDKGESYPLGRRDRVVLSPEGDGVIAFQGGTVVEMKGGTDVSLYQMEKPPVTRLYLSAGELWSQVVRFLDTGGRFEIQTPAAVVSVRGTLFRTRALSDVATYSATDEGGTSVTLLDPEQGNPSVEVPAGYEVTAVVGEPLVVRPQRPNIDNLYLGDKALKIKAGEVVASSASRLEIAGQSKPGVDVVLLFLLKGEEIARTSVGADGSFHLDFEPTVEGEYPLCLLVEDVQGHRSDCVEFTFLYDRTPPATLQLMEPTTSEVHSAEITLRGITEPGATLTLNGESIAVDEKGNFETTVALNEGDNPFSLESCDAAGNCTYLDFTLTRR